MASDLNMVALVGRLTRNCDMKYTNSGFAICSFTLAVNRRRKQQDGTWQDQASFFDCSYFGKAAEGVSPYLQKGQQVAIQGSLEQQSWEKDGQKRSKIAVIVDNVELIGGGNKTSAAGSSGGVNGGYASQTTNSFTGATTRPQGGFNSFTAPPAASFVGSVKTTTPPPKGPELFEDDGVPF